LRKLATLGIAGVASQSIVAQAAAPLASSEGHTLSAAGDALVPGAAKAGIVPFVTAMLSSHCPALFYDYLSLPMEPDVFYRAALAAIRSFALLHGGHAFDTLPREARERLLAGLLSPSLPGWSGPPPMLVYTVLRNDAIDVVYGTESAYEDLRIPYMPHIEPPKLW
jgi:hypothetical protein